MIDLAPGSVICPGFIDAHAHAEGPLLATGRLDGALAQGVTTLVVGQDGESWIGGTADTVRYLNQYFAPVNGVLGPARDLSLTAYREAVTGRLTQNVAVLASQGTIRHNVAGLRPDPLGPGERSAARRQVEDALAEGAVGLSSGLDYLPSRFGGIDEIADMAQPLAAAGRPYVSHLRAAARTSGPAWTSWPPSGAARASGCTPATCGASRPTSRRRSGSAEALGVGHHLRHVSPQQVQHDPGDAAAPGRHAGRRPGADARRADRPGAARGSAGAGEVHRRFPAERLPGLPARRRWRSSPGSRSRRPPGAARGQPASGFSTCWSVRA